MLDKFKQVYELRKQAKKVQKELNEVEIEAKSNNGQVKVVINGQMQILEIKISPEAFNAGNVLSLENSLKETITQAINQSQKISAEKSKDIMKSMGMDIPGL